MWHEARKQEKKIRGIMNDFYKRRSERRKQFYDIVKTDPMRFLQLHGSKCRIHYDGVENEESQMMKWDNDILIDRFDVRAHLDHIPPTIPKKDEDEIVDKESSELSYERYRVIIQNEFLGVSEDLFLNQLTFEEKFGVSAHETRDEKSKKKNSQSGAAIGFNYGGESSVQSNNVLFSQQILSIETPKENRYDEFAKDLSDCEDSDADVDGFVDLNKLSEEYKKELNSAGKKYGLLQSDFSRFLKRDEDQRQLSKKSKEEDNKQPQTGKNKYRRTRKMDRERVIRKQLSPPSYAAVEEKVTEEKEESDQSSEHSRSPSREKITFITSFGGEEEDEMKRNNKNLKSSNSRLSSSFADVVKENSSKLKRLNRDERTRTRRRSYSSSDRDRRSYSRERRKSPDYRRRYRRSRSRSRSRRSRSRYSRSRSPRRSPRRRRRSPSPRRPKYSSPKRSYREKDDDQYRRRSKTRSRSRSQQECKNLSKVKEIAPIPKSETTIATSLIPEIPSTSQTTVQIPPIKRYYGRRKSNESSSSMSANSEDESFKKNQKSKFDATKFNQADTKAKTTSKPESSSNSVREIQKKKLQILLNKQYKADKKAENERKEREKIMQQQREEEMRELSLKMRKQEREKRHFFHDLHKKSSSESETEIRSRRKSRSSSSSSSTSDSFDYSHRR